MNLRLWLIAVVHVYVLSSTYAGERATLLRQTLEKADRVVVEDPPDPTAQAAKAVTITGAEKIAAFVGKLEFDDARSGFHCMCYGDSIVTFYQQDKKVAVLSHHHGRSVRWHSKLWKGDALFTTETAVLWRTWFKENGEMRFENMHLEAEREAKQRALVHKEFMAPLPAKAVAVFVKAAKEDDGMISFSPEDFEADEGNNPRAKELAAVFADPVEMGTAICQALGSLARNGAQSADWSVTTARETLALKCAGTLNGPDFLKVLEQAKEHALIGCARLFFAERLSKKLSPQERALWAPKLARAVLQSNAGDNSTRVLRALASQPGREATAVLIDTAKGNIGKGATPTGGDEPSDRMTACLLLAQAGNKDAAALAKDFTKSNKLSELDQAALQVIESLAGGHKLDAKIFEVDSFTVALAALKALEKQGDREALDAIINGGTDHSYAAVREKSVLAAERLTGKKWYMNGRNERAEWHVEKVRDWWKANRSSFVKKSP